MAFAIVAVAIVIIVLLTIFVYKESTGFNVTEYVIETDKPITRDLNIVMLSDLHDTDLGDDNKQVLEKIGQLNPDFVLLAGDMITSYMQPKYNSDVTFSFLEKLAKDNDVYYGLGNHEQRYLSEPDKFPGKFDALKRFVCSCGINFLQNDFADIPELNVRIYGLNIPIEYYRRVVTKKLPDDYVSEIFGNMPGDKLNIMMAHNPDQFDTYVKGRPDVVVSGHIHGGIVGVPKLGGLISPQLKLFPKYDFGIFREDITTMVLGRGLGWHTIPIRIWNKAEIVNIRIVKKNF